MKSSIEPQLPYNWRRVMAVCLLAIMISGYLRNATTVWAVNRGKSAAPASAEHGAPATVKKDLGPEHSEVATRIEEILRRPEFQNAHWGMQFYFPDTNKVMYSLNSDQLFQPASAVKVFVAGSAFDDFLQSWNHHIGAAA